MTKTFHFDIAIVGGGLAGSLAALALSNRGFSCALIDASDPAAMRGGAFDGRTSALSYASARVYKRLGLWDAIKLYQGAPDAEPIRDILVTDGRASSRFGKGGASPLFLHFDSRELGEDQPLGYIIENRRLREVMFDAIEADDNIVQFAPARRAGTRFDKGAGVIHLEDGREISSLLIIAADGRSSALRGEAKIKTNHWGCGQAGIVTTVAHERPHNGVAQEFFLPSGPFAILPMTPVGEGRQSKIYRSSLVWTEQEKAAPAYMALSDEDFLKAVEQRFGTYLGSLSLTGPRWSYPFAFTLAQSYVAPRLALIGDAAHAVHPIAGQGFNLGVKDIAALADVLRDGRDVGLDIGALTVLQDYQRWRRFDSMSLALGMDFLNRLFSNDIGPLRLARDIGMSTVGKIGPVRNFFMREAGADMGSLPSLMAAES